MVICGPSGSGKSTFLRCVNRLEQVQRGECSSTARAARGPGEHEFAAPQDRVRVQQFHLFPHLTVREKHHAAPIKLRRLTSERRPRRLAEELLARVQIPEKADAYPSISRAASSSASPSPARWR